MASPYLKAYKKIAEKSEEGAWCEIMDPIEGESTGIFIKVVGIDSSVYKKAEKKRTKKLFEAQFAKAGRPRVRGVRRSNDVDLDPDLLEQASTELLVACTLAWKMDSEDLQDDSHIYLEEGVPLECTKENVRMVYTEHPWVREQVDEFIAVRANFL